MKLIAIADYAAKHGIKADTVRQKCLRGGFYSAQKIGKIWAIDEDEPFLDLRKKNSKKEKMEASMDFFIV